MIAFNPAAPMPFFIQCAKKLESENPAVHSSVKKTIKEVINLCENKDPIVQAFNQMITSRAASHKVIGLYGLKKMKLLEKDRTLFPFEIEDKQGLINPKSYLNDVKTINFPEIKEEIKFCGYVVNMPIVIDEIDPSETDAKVTRILDMLRDDTFGRTQETSRARCPEDLCVVLGANRCKSIDRIRNRAFKNYIKTFSNRSDINATLFGFMWEPQWKCGGKSVGHKEVKDYYKVLKRLDSVSAERFRKRLEEPATGIGDRVPYQEIRETIKNSTFTKCCVRHLRSTDGYRPVYLSIMDPDFLRLRSNGWGLFSHYNNLILNHYDSHGVYPTIASTGYQASTSEHSIMQLGVELDQSVREALAKVFPLAPYLPEPNIIILVEQDEDTVRESFINIWSKNKESRHLIANVIRNRGLDPATAIVFRTLGAVTTTIPRRFYKGGFFPQVSKSLIGQKWLLQRLRGMCQSSINPIGGWPMSVDNALSKHKEEIREQLTLLFGLFDPINLAFMQQQNREYSVTHNFNPMMKAYEVHAKAMQEAIHRYKNTIGTDRDFMDRDQEKSLVTNAVNAFLQVPELTPIEQQNCVALFRTLLHIFTESYGVLVKQGLSNDEIFAIAEASRLSGQAIFTILDRVHKG